VKTHILRAKAKLKARLASGKDGRMSQRNDDWIERQLREDARRPLEDSGFTAPVLSRLPARAAPQPWLRTALILGSTAIGCILAALLGPVGPLVVDGFRELFNFRGMTPGMSAMIAMTLVLAVSGYVLATDD
jgi:hypothetical protein